MLKVSVWKFSVATREPIANVATGASCLFAFFALNWGGGHFFYNSIRVWRPTSISWGTNNLFNCKLRVWLKTHRRTAADNHRLHIKENCYEQRVFFYHDF